MPIYKRSRHRLQIHNQCERTFYSEFDVAFDRRWNVVTCRTLIHISTVTWHVQQLQTSTNRSRRHSSIWNRFTKNHNKHNLSSLSTSTRTSTEIISEGELHSGSSQGQSIKNNWFLIDYYWGPPKVPKTGDTEPVDMQTWFRTVEDDLRPLNFGLASTELNSRRRLRLPDMLRRVCIIFTYLLLLWRKWI